MVVELGVNLVENLTERCRMIAGKTFGDYKNPQLHSGRQEFFVSY
jgi:hypothetical protein